MPKYEFKCKDCGNDFEESMKAEQYDPKPECPKCKSVNTQRIFDFASLFGLSSGDSCGPSHST